MNIVIRLEATGVTLQATRISNVAPKGESDLHHFQNWDIQPYRVILFSKLLMKMCLPLFFLGKKIALLSTTYNLMNILCSSSCVRQFVVPTPSGLMKPNFISCWLHLHNMAVSVCCYLQGNDLVDKGMADDPCKENCPLLYQEYFLENF